MGLWLSITQIWLNTWKSQMVDRLSSTSSSGFSVGSVTFLKICKARAPSICAASISSLGTCVRPA